jgi:putative DNA primase/helicase
MMESNIIPCDLRALPQWLVWKLVPAKPKPKKVPYNPRHPERWASTTDATTWGTYDEAVQTCDEHQFAGIGFVFSKDDPFVGIDLDNCRNPETGELTPGAQRTVEKLDSYCEVSPSGTGVHIIVKGTLPKKGRKKGDVEIYENGRYFTMTGQHMADTPLEICERQDALNQFHAETFKTAEPGKPHPINGNSPKRTSPPPLDDAALIQKAIHAKNGAKFQALWSGDWTGYTSPSEADLALCRLLAYWANGHSETMDRLFRQSGLYRPKWDTLRHGSTYGHRTILKALELRD